MYCTVVTTVVVAVLYDMREEREITVLWAKACLPDIVPIGLMTTKLPGALMNAASLSLADISAPLSMVAIANLF